jgi:hypothetical protein
MATIKEQELKKELKLALIEVGAIKPWFDEEVQAWVFEHPLYPVEYGGDSPEEVIENYPKYLEVFIEHRMQGRLADFVEKETKGRGGYRLGAGRPKGSYKEPKLRVYVPADVAEWLKISSNMKKIRYLMKEKVV